MPCTGSRSPSTCAIFCHFPRPLAESWVGVGRSWDTNQHSDRMPLLQTIASPAATQHCPKCNVSKTDVIAFSNLLLSWHQGSSNPHGRWKALQMSPQGLHSCSSVQPRVFVFMLFPLHTAGTPGSALTLLTHYVLRRVLLDFLPQKKVIGTTVLGSAKLSQVLT